MNFRKFGVWGLGFVISLDILKDVKIIGSPEINSSMNKQPFFLPIESLARPRSSNSDIVDVGMSNNIGQGIRNGDNNYIINAENNIENSNINYANINSNKRDTKVLVSDIITEHEAGTTPPNIGE